MFFYTHFQIFFELILFEFYLLVVCSEDTGTYLSIIRCAPHMYLTLSNCTFLGAPPLSVQWKFQS